MNTDTPLVSVAMLVYNQRDFIGQAIESVLAQETDFPIELRIGDDFSTDGTREVLERYRAMHPDKIFLNLQPRRPDGVPGRTNNLTNLASCRGRYIALLDGDDFWTDRHKLRDQIALLEAEPRLAGACHDTAILREPEGEIASQTVSEYEGRGSPPKQAEFDLADINRRAIFHSSSFCFRATALGELPAWFSHVLLADWALFHLVARSGPIRYESGCRSTYRRHSDSIFKVYSAAQVRAHILRDLETFWEIFPTTRTHHASARIERSRATVAKDRGAPLQSLTHAARWLSLELRSRFDGAGRFAS